MGSDHFCIVENTKKFLGVVTLLFILTSCPARTQILFQDPLVLRGSWVAIIGEGAAISTIKFEFQASQDCTKKVENTLCDEYGITGSALIGGELFPVTKGSGGLGYEGLLSPIIPMFELDAKNGTESFRLSGKQESDAYQVSFSGPPSLVSKLGLTSTTGILKKVTKAAN